MSSTTASTIDQMISLRKLNIMDKLSKRFNRRSFLILILLFGIDYTKDIVREQLNSLSGNVWSLVKSYYNRAFQKKIVASNTTNELTVGFKPNILFFQGF
jgi:hypothetical protein